MSNTRAVPRTTAKLFLILTMSRNIYHRFFLILIIVILQETRFSYGGSCWLSMNRNGKCSQLISTGGLREDCCSKGVLSSSVAASWTDEDLLSPSSIFYMHIQGGAPCAKCKDSCDGVKCQENQKCAIRNGRPKCICAPNCAAFKLQNRLNGGVRGPLCGTDGRTYKSMCRLLKRSCRKKVAISMAYSGSCKNSCSKLNCLSMKQCLLDQNLTPHCVNCTQKKCSMGSKVLSGRKSICAIDKQTYASVCHLRQAACNKGKAIPISYKGPCKKFATCNTVTCSAGQKCFTEKKNEQPRCVSGTVTGMINPWVNG